MFKAPISCFVFFSISFEKILKQKIEVDFGVKIKASTIKISKVNLVVFFFLFCFSSFLTYFEVDVDFYCQ